MSTSEEKTPPRQHLLPVILVGVFGLSVLIALLIAGADEPAKSRGAEILDQIRTRRLSSWWSDEPVEAWYLIRNVNGNAIGWQLIIRQFEDGVFFGSTEIRTQKNVVYEQWEINDGATEGRYVGQGRIDGQPVKTVTTLSDGRIYVNSTAWPQKVSSAAPLNYVPEGLISLVIYLTAVGAEPVICRSIIDSAAIIGNRVHFFTSRIEPEGPQSARVTLAGIDSVDLYQFDARGELKRSDSTDGTSVIRVSHKDVLRAFPNIRPITPLGPASDDDETSDEYESEEAAYYAQP